jgi:hypothetical protein
MMVCSQEDCAGSVIARGLCAKHYKRVQRKGRADGGHDRIHGMPSAFLEMALEMETDECIIWPYASIGRPGAKYGTVRSGGRTRLCNRIACEEENGPAPSDEHEAAHRCGITLCINKKHVRWATPLENAADKKCHGTEPMGEDHHSAKLTEEGVGMARATIGQESNVAIAAQLKVHPATISSVRNRRSWDWLK